MQNSPSGQVNDALKEFLPLFYEAVHEFPDFKSLPPLAPREIADLEKKLNFEFARELQRLFESSACISMNGLSVRADRLATIALPNSEALLLGEFYLNNAGDRLLMLPADPAVYYLEQRDGNILRLAPNIEEFFNKTLPRLLN